MTIQYLIGDATKPIQKGNKIIAHVCNCNNGFGSGFVVAITRRWDKPKQAFHSLFKDFPSNRWHEYLGITQYVAVESDIIVANMIAQKGYGKNNANKHRTSEPNTEIPLQYSALEACMIDVAVQAKEWNACITSPRFGSDRAGGNWSEIEKLINKHWEDINVFIYDLPKK